MSLQQGSPQIEKVKTELKDVIPIKNHFYKNGHSKGIKNYQNIIYIYTDQGLKKKITDYKLKKTNRGNIMCLRICL